METAQDLTGHNLGIAAKVADLVRDLTVGFLVTGSNSWGANYAVNKSSDIDLVAVTKNTQGVLNVVRQLVDNQIVKKGELNRARLFIKLRGQGQVDVFSISESTKFGQLSIDIVTQDIVYKIVNLKPLRKARCSDSQSTINLRVLCEYRTNPPKDSGYTVDDLGSKRVLTYHPKFKKTEYGYLAESLIDSLDGSYFMGVYAFFFLVEPMIIADTDSCLAGAVKTFQQNIKGLLNGRIVHITREERMSDKVRKQITKKLG